MAIKERVAAGVQWLDSNHPNWRQKINIEKLDMVSFSECILGQIFGNYFAQELKLVDKYNFGFTVDGEGSPRTIAADWQALQAEWLRVLNGENHDSNLH